MTDGKYPRYCDVTHEGMWEGWCINDGESYIKHEADALKCATDAGYKDIEQAYEDEFMYWTDWHEIPKDEWDQPPTNLICGEKYPRCHFCGSVDLELEDTTYASMNAMTNHVRCSSCGTAMELKYEIKLIEIK